MRPMNLGELAAALERKDGSLKIRFEFGQFGPSKLASWRGDYAQLAVEYAEFAEITVGEFLKILREADGKTFTGYKGGEFTMNERTPIWVSAHGQAASSAIVDVDEFEGDVTLRTALCSYP